MNGVNSDPVQNTFSGGFPMEKNSMFDRNKQYALCPCHEVTRIINGKVYIITRHFIGNKNVGEVLSQLALSKALSETLKKK